MRCMYFIPIFIIFFVSPISWAGNATSFNILDKRLIVYGGVQRYEAKGEFSSTKEGRPTVNIDLDDLGLDENEVTPVFGLKYKISKRWNMRLDYYGYHEDETRTADFEFNFEDLIVPVGARVDTSIDVDIYVANLSYDIVHSRNARFGLGIGAHVADLDLEISGKVTSNETEVPLGEGHEELLAPLPNLYATGSYAITDNFLFRCGGGWISLSYDDYDGELIFANAFLEYWPFRHAGFGLGYRYVEADIDYDSGKKVEKYDIQLPGPLAYVVFGF